MIIGIFAEGRGDLAVITNILKGQINIDRSDIRYELPEYEYDQTDLHTMPKGQHNVNGQTDTSLHQRPKERLDTELNRILKAHQKSMLKAKTFEKYDWLSSDFRKKKKLLVCTAKNESLKLFCESLDTFKAAE